MDCSVYAVAVCVEKIFDVRKLVGITTASAYNISFVSVEGFLRGSPCPFGNQLGEGHQGSSGE